VREAKHQQASMQAMKSLSKSLGKSRGAGFCGAPEIEELVRKATNSKLPGPNEDQNQQVCLSNPSSGKTRSESRLTCGPKDHVLGVLSKRNRNSGAICRDLGDAATVCPPLNCQTSGGCFSPVGPETH
jgi:hypothetical protein